MRVFVMGGTGLIGRAVVRELTARGHRVLALARSATAADNASRLGAEPLAGDIAAPEIWASSLAPVDAVIHLACDFDSAMGAIDRHLLDVLLPRLAAQARRPRFIYTGGNWLFGATGNVVATEASPFAPIDAFAWMVAQLERVRTSRDVEGIIIHPAMVHAANGGGVFRRFARDAAERHAVRVVGSEAVRWPLVRDDDLAALYALALQAAPGGASYIGAAVDGVPVGRIARAFARRRGLALEIVSVEAIARELGDWARGYGIDQQLSGDKARRELGWSPRHLDPAAEIAALP